MTTAACAFCHLPVPLRRGKSLATTDDAPVYCCYGCSLAARVTAAASEAGQLNWLLTRLGVSVFLTMGVMVISLALYGHHIYGLKLEEAPRLAVSFTGLLRYVSLILATPVFLLLGLPLISDAITQARTSVRSTDLLVMLGVTGAYLHSYLSTLTNQGAIYYETACIILVLVTLGRYLEATGKLRASESVRALESLLPDRIRVLRNGLYVELQPQEARVGDLVQIASGSRVPIDGAIEAGQGHFDERIITGESRLVERRAGDVVRAGTVAADGAFTIRTTAVGAQSTLGRLANLLQEAKRTRSRFQRMADRVGTWFIPTVILLAGVAAVIGFQASGWEGAMLAALSVALIACPCALGIATPLAIWVAMECAARHGVLFRHGEGIERLADIHALAFDKTGTLTTGDPTVHSFLTRSSDAAWVRKLLSVAAGLAATTNHALARMVERFALDKGIWPQPVASSQTFPGRGVCATINGAVLRLGSLRMMEEESVRFDAKMRAEADRALSGGHALVCLGWDRIVAAVFAVSETIRREAAQALSELRAMGYAVRILTGDHASQGRNLADQLCVDVIAGLTPDDKVNQVLSMRAECGPVAMVGDGLNDAPALGAADVGMAMGCGADLTRESADVCLLGNNLLLIPWLLRLSRLTVRTVKVNLFWAFAYNAAGMSLAVAGMLSPIFAALAMTVSSLLVVSNSLRLQSRITVPLPGDADDPVNDSRNLIPRAATAAPLP